LSRTVPATWQANSKCYPFLFFKKRFIYLFEREKESRGRERENPQAESLLSAKPNAGLDPTTLRS